MAITITAETLHVAIGGSLEIATRVLEVAKERVNITAPNAPDPICNEAVIRYAGYLVQSDFGGIRKEEIGPMSREWVTNHANAWRNSGAYALLSPWVIRRAGSI